MEHWCRQGSTDGTLVPLRSRPAAREGGLRWPVPGHVAHRPHKTGVGEAQLIGTMAAVVDPGGR